jgi:1-deoxyxylulose-5-phosphate synthase
VTDSRPLGRSGLLVSPLGLGTATFGREVPPAEATRIVHAYLDRGFTFIDTADSYADGAAETILGAALAGRRDAVVLATKAGLPLHPGPDRTRASRRHLLMAVEGSLRRLRTDHVDLFYLHRWDDQAPIEESASTLDALVAAGKVRYVAASNLGGWQLAWTASVQARNGWEPLVAVQSRYSLASRDAEREILPYSRWAGLGFVAFAPLAGGILTAKYRPGGPFPDGSRGADQVLGATLRHRLAARGGQVTRELSVLAAAAGATAAQIALAWLLRRPGVSSAVVGVTSLAQLEENLAAASLPVGEPEAARLDELTAPTLGYPYDLLRQLGSAGRESLP